MLQSYDDGTEKWQIEPGYYKGAGGEFCAEYLRGSVAEVKDITLTA